MKSVGYIMTGFTGAVVAILAFFLSLPFLPDRLVPISASFGPSMEYTDFLTVMFAGATLIITALAIFVGLAAIFTYQGIKDEARRTIENEVEGRTPKVLNAIDSRIKEMIEGKSRQLDTEISTHIQQALEKAGREGKLDDALQRALVAINSGLSTLDQEVDDDLEDNDER